MNSLQDYILTLDNVLTHSLCDAILREYAGSPHWQQTVVGSGDVRPDIRSAHTIQISQDAVMQENPSVRKPLDAYVFTSVGEAIRKYNAKFGHCNIEEDSGYELLRYETGQFYTQHTDSFKARPRAVSCSLALNDDYEGGGFAFFDRGVTYRVPKGGAILFPSNFMFPHEILPVTHGTRYSIVTWFI